MRDLIERIDAALSLTKAPPWSADALNDLLRYGRKNEGPWDDHGTLPHDYDSEKIVEMPGLLAEAKLALVAAEIDKGAILLTGDDAARFRELFPNGIVDRPL